MSKATGAAKARATVTHEGRTTKTVVEELPALIVDGVTYEFDFGAITALDDDDLSAQSNAGLTLAEVVDGSGSYVQSIRHVAALMWLSLRQRGQGKPYREVAASLRLDSTVEMRTPDPEEEAPAD
jgi:hypothetical protein